MPTLVANFKFNDSTYLTREYVNTRDNFLVRTDVEPAVDPEYGVVASFTGKTSILNISSYNVRTSFPQLYGKNNYTICAWIKASDTILLHRIGSNSQYKNVVAFFGASSGLSYFNAVDGISDSYDDNEWHHVAMTRVGNYFSYYVDGVRKVYKSRNFTTGLSKTVIGAGTGFMSDYRIYTGIHDEAGIKSIYDEGMTPVVQITAKISSVVPMSTTLVVNVDNPDNNDVLVSVDGTEYDIVDSQVIIRGLENGESHSVNLIFNN